MHSFFKKRKAARWPSASKREKCFITKNGTKGGGGGGRQENRNVKLAQPFFRWRLMKTCRRQEHEKSKLLINILGEERQAFAQSFLGGRDPQSSGRV